MGNYLCYLCNAEFWTTGGLRKHYEKDRCPRVTKEMKELALRPFCRVLIKVSYVNPLKFGNKEKFLYSYNVETLRKDYKERLIEVAKEIGIGLDSKRYMPLSHKSIGERK